MHLLILGMNYAPEQTGIGPYTSGLAEHMVQHGHRVTVVTAFPHYPQWRQDASYAHGRRFVHWERQGVALRRGWVSIPRNRSARQRVAYDTSLAVTALLNALPLRSVDLVLSISPPLQLALTGALLAALHRAPLLLLLKDLVPDAGVAVGMLQPGRLLQMARLLERFVYRRADGIIVIGEGFRANLAAKGVSPDVITYIPDWADTARIRPMARDNAFRRQLQVGSDQLIILHTGNMGAKQGLRTVIEAAALLRDVPELLFLLVGDGAERHELESLAQVQRLSNVRFLPLQPAADLPDMLASADLLLLIQRREVTDAVVPSKLLAYLAAARPVLAAVNPASAAATILTASGGGILVPPEEPAALAGAIRRWRSTATDHSGPAQRARSFVVEHYGRQNVLERYRRYLEGWPRSTPDQGPAAATMRR
jgi:colanic acid biosynthesis glycosyl transferase WcaI